MPNTLTDLANDIQLAADTIGRELVGFIPAVTLNAGSAAAAKGDTVRSHVTRQPVLNTSATPAMTIPEGDNQTIDSKTLILDQIGNVQIPWEGEEVVHMDNGIGWETVYGDQILQAMRTIANAIEVHCATVAYQGASRAVGVAATTPFGTDHKVVNEMRQVLVDNGAPATDPGYSFVMNTSAGTNFRNLSNVYKVNEAGTDQLLRQGVLQDISGFMMRESAGTADHTQGTGAGYLVNNGPGYAVGATDIAIDTGTGTVVAGDIVTFAGDTNKYIVTSGVAAPGTITIGTPGLRLSLADGVAMTIGGDFAANVGIHRSGMELAIRPLAKPKGGDAAVDEIVVQDSHSGLAFRVSDYRGYHKAMFDITTLYKAKVWKEDFVSVLMG